MLASVLKSRRKVSSRATNMRYCAITIALFVVYSTQILRVANGSQKICMQLENVDSDETRRHSHGTQGKKGPKGDVGPQGLVGLVGPPGRVDYERINATILATCNKKIQDLRTEFQQKMNDMESRIVSLTPNCEITYSSVCYWTEIHSSHDTNFAEGESICEQRQSTVADVIDQAQYKLIVEKIRSKIPEDQMSVGVWIGLRQNPSNGVVTLSSGVSAQYLKWHPRDPSRASSDTNIALSVKKDAASSDQGMFDARPTWNANGVVCQSKSQ